MSQQLVSPGRSSSGLQPWENGSNDLSGGPRLVFHWPSVVLAAVVASSAITFYMMFIPELLEVEMMDIGITIGAMVDPAGGLGAFLVRVLWHVGHGLVYVPVYAAALLWFQQQSTAWTGIVFGVFLWLAGPMLLIPVVLSRPWVCSGELVHPGIFMLDLGLGWAPAAIDLGAHLTHGILAGVICKLQRS